MKQTNKSFIPQSIITFLTLLLLLGLIISSPVVNAQDSNYEVKQDFEYYGMDLRSEHSHYPDKVKHIRGLDYIKISTDKDHIIINISDSLFIENYPPRITLIVQDSSFNSEMPVGGRTLSSGNELRMHPESLLQNKDYVRVVVWITNIGDNDAKRVLEIRRNPKAKDNLTVNSSDKEAIIKGLAYISVSTNNTDLILNISDSLFLNNSFPFLSVGVQNSKVSEMPILGEVLNEAGELRLSLPLIMQNLDSARVVIWINNTGLNDAKRVVSVFRNTSDQTFSISATP